MVEEHMFDMARMVNAYQALGKGFDLVFCDTRARRSAAKLLEKLLIEQTKSRGYRPAKTD